jgi:hypothetical protein
MAKFKHEVVLCMEEKRNHNATTTSGSDESNIRLLQKYKTAISECEVLCKKFTGTM